MDSKGGIVMQVKKAIIPCAGFGTRFLPATKVMPKELLPIVDTPALLYIVKEAVESGIEEIMIVISPQKESIKSLFEGNQRLNEHLSKIGDSHLLKLANADCKAKIHFVTQESMTGNANAIKLCKEFANNQPFAVLFGDDVMYTKEGERPVIGQLIDAYDKTGASIVGCQKTSEEVARRCGVMQTKSPIENGICDISGIEEKPVGELPSSLVSLGRFVLAPSIFDAIASTPASQSGEVYLTDAISNLAKCERVCACEFTAKRYDIGNKEGYLEATVEFALRDKNLSEEFSKYLKTLKLD